jgi:hypothetical protein
MAVKGDTHSAEAPATESIPILGGRVTCPAFWWPEVTSHTDRDRKVGYSLACKPSDAKAAAEWAQGQLEAMNVVVPR